MTGGVREVDGNGRFRRPNRRSGTVRISIREPWRSRGGSLRSPVAWAPVTGCQSGHAPHPAIAPPTRRVRVALSLLATLRTFHFGLKHARPCRTQHFLLLGIARHVRAGRSIAHAARVNPKEFVIFIPGAHPRQCESSARMGFVVDNTHTTMRTKILAVSGHRVTLLLAARCVCAASPGQTRLLLGC